MKINTETLIYIILGLGALIVKVYSEKKQKNKKILESPNYDFEKEIKTKSEPVIVKHSKPETKIVEDLSFMDSDIYNNENKRKERKFKINYREAIIFSEILKRPNF